MSMFAPGHCRALASRWGSLLALVVVAACVLGCQARKVRIAIIPQTTGTDLWVPVLAGAQSAAAGRPVSIYWNAPTNPGNVRAQIAMLERIIHSGKYDGIILAPDHSLALMDAVEDARAANIPVVVISSRVDVPATRGLSYILNNDAAGGGMAARYLGKLLHGHGTVALLGIDPSLDGNMERTRGFEAALRKGYPGVTIVARRFGAYNVPHEQQVAIEILKRHPGLNAIVALNTASERGVWSALLGLNETKQVRVVGFDQDIPFDGPIPAWFDQDVPFDGSSLKLDALVKQNTYKMGEMAVQQILADLHHQPVPPLTWIEPTLVTRQSSADTGLETQPSDRAGGQP